MSMRTPSNTFSDVLKQRVAQGRASTVSKIASGSKINTPRTPNTPVGNLPKTPSCSSIIKTRPSTKKCNIQFADKPNYYSSIPKQYNAAGQEIPKDILYAKQMIAERSSREAARAAEPKPGKKTPRSTSEVRRKPECMPKSGAPQRKPPQSARADLRCRPTSAGSTTSTRTLVPKTPIGSRLPKAGPASGMNKPRSVQAKLKPGGAQKSIHLQMAAKTNDPFEKEIYHQIDMLEKDINMRLAKFEEKLFAPDMLQNLSKKGAVERFERIEAIEFEKEKEVYDQLHKEVVAALSPEEEIYNINDLSNRTAMRSHNQKLQELISKLEITAAEIKGQIEAEEAPLTFKPILPPPKAKPVPSTRTPRQEKSSAMSRTVPKITLTSATPAARKVAPPKTLAQKTPRTPAPIKPVGSSRFVTSTARKQVLPSPRPADDGCSPNLLNVQSTPSPVPAIDFEHDTVRPVDRDSDNEPEITHITFAEINDSLEQTKRIIFDSPVLKEIILGDDYFPGFMDDAINAELNFYSIRDIENADAVTLVKAFDLRVKMEQDNIHKNINSSEAEKDFFLKAATEDFKDFPGSLRDEILQSGIIAVDLQSNLRGPQTNFLDAIDSLTKAELLCQYDAALRGVDKAKTESAKISSFHADITEESFAINEDESIRPIEIISYVGVTQPTNCR